MLLIKIRIYKGKKHNKMFKYFQIKIIQKKKSFINFKNLMLLL